MKNVPMNKSLKSIAVAALLLTMSTACSIFPETDPVQLLDPQPPSSASTGQPRAWTLNVYRPEADPARDSTRVLVRTGQGQLQVHATARWVAAAPDLLRTLLVRYMRDANVLSEISAGAAGMDRTLALDLRRFELVETGDQQLAAEIRIEARLFDGRSAELLDRRLFERREPVGNADSDAIIRGFNSVLGEIVPALAAWLTGEGPAPAGDSPG